MWKKSLIVATLLAIVLFTVVPMVNAATLLDIHIVRYDELSCVTFSGFGYWGSSYWQHYYGGSPTSWRKGFFINPWSSQRGQVRTDFFNLDWRCNKIKYMVYDSSYYGNMNHKTMVKFKWDNGATKLVDWKGYSTWVTVNIPFKSGKKATSYSIRVEYTGITGSSGVSDGCKKIEVRQWT